MKKVLLIGEVYSENLGDPLIYSMVASILSDYYSDCEIVPLDLSGRASYEDFLPPPKNESVIRRLNHLNFHLTSASRAYNLDFERHIRVKSRLEELISQIRFDLAVFAGGALFMDFFAGIIHMICKRLKQSGVPVVFHACGMGGLTADSETLLKSVFHMDNVVSVSLRDSFDRFQTTFGVPYVRTYDSALLCSQRYEPAEQKRPQVGVGLIDSPELQDTLREVIRHLERSGIKWLTFTNGAQNDYAAGKKLLHDLEIDTTSRLLPRPQTVSQLVQDITSFDCIISCRLHSQIIAASFGIVNHGIVWNEKVADFHNMMGSTQRCHTLKSGHDFLDHLERMYNSTLHQRALAAGEHSKIMLLEATERCIKP